MVDVVPLRASSISYPRDILSCNYPLGYITVHGTYAAYSILFQQKKKKKKVLDYLIFLASMKDRTCRYVFFFCGGA